MIQLSQWDLSATCLGHTEVTFHLLVGEPWRQSASEAPVEVNSVLEEQERERWMVIQDTWLVPMLGMVFSEQALKGVRKGILEQWVLQLASVQPRLLRLCSGNPSRFTMGSTRRGGSVGA